jgi:prevent-host-death family protein
VDRGVGLKGTWWGTHIWLDARRPAAHILTNVGQEAGMETVNLYDAKTNLSNLVERAARGEEIVIAKAGRPLARLVPLARRTAPRPLGLLAGQVTVGDDFDDPLPDEIGAAFAGESR